MNGAVRSVPFLTMRITPPFCVMNIRPSLANVIPTGVNTGKVATVSTANPESVKVCAEVEIPVNITMTTNQIRLAL